LYNSGEENMNKLIRLSALLLCLSLFCAAQNSPATPVPDYSGKHARTVADWARDGIVYEVFERQFSPAGTFNGITDRLDELKKYGFDILWLMPINPIGEKEKKGTVGSPYAIRDYYKVNPQYGTADDLKRLVKEAHARNMKVIVDVVYNHTSWDNTLVTEHPAWFKHDKAGKITYPSDWSDVAAIDYTNPALRAYITDNMKFWVKEYDIDGFRCDVAAGEPVNSIPAEFWEQARAEVEKIKPSIYMLAEAHQPSQLVKAFDSDYSWPLLHAINDVIWGAKPATALHDEWKTEVNTFPSGSVHLRIADDHDETRLIVRVGERAALAAQAFVFTIDGIPLVYNGMEVGDSSESGAPALFEKAPIIWNISERRKQYPRFYLQMSALRHSSEALRRGSLEWLDNSESKRAVSYLRHGQTEDVLVVINMSNQQLHVLVPKSPNRGWTDVTPDLSDKKTDEAATSKVAPSGAAFVLAPYEFRILKKAKQ
jgi:cyclomaltodextrinase / maltogenic alpha-amylase / neopullulanase